jgi:hypothetical protein
VDAVAWIAGRQYVLSLFFWLILLRVYLDWVDENKTTTYLSMMVLSLLGSLAGPRVFIVAPVVLLLLDAWPLKRMGAGVERPADAVSPLLARIREKIPLCGVAALVPLVLWVVGTEAERYGEAPVGISVLAAKLTGPGFLLAEFFCLPSPASLGAAAPPVVQASVAFLLLCGISAAVAAAGKRCPAMLTGWIWFLATALFAATPIGTGAGTTHPWGYLPVTGLIFLVAAMGSAADGGRNKSRIAVAALGVGMVFLLALNAGAKLDQWSRSSSVSRSAGTIRLSNGWPTKIPTLTGTVAVRYPPD